MKPHITEDQHIREHEIKMRLSALEAEQRTATEAERSRLKALHWMHCPKCGQRLSTEQYCSVEIDVCPSCRGLWLDANELDTILASSSGILGSCLRLLGQR